MLKYIIGMIVTSSTTATAAMATARLGATAHVEPGRQVRLAVDTGKLHLFDPATTSRFV
jgi:hypothetical protein